MKRQPIDTAPKDGTVILVYGENSNRSHKCIWNPEMNSWNEDCSDLVDSGCWETLCCHGWFEPSEVKFWQPLSKSGKCGCELEIYY